MINRLGPSYVFVYFEHMFLIKRFSFRLITYARQKDFFSNSQDNLSFDIF